MPFIETLQEFHDRMNCKHVETREGRIYENGARIVNNIAYDPPDDKADLLRTAIEYESKRIENAEKQYIQISTYLKNQIKTFELGAGPGPEEEAFTAIRRIKKDVRDMKAKVDQLKLELKLTIGPTRADERERENQERMQQAEKYRRRAAQL